MGVDGGGGRGPRHRDQPRRRGGKFDPLAQPSAWKPTNASSGGRLDDCPSSRRRRERPSTRRLLRSRATRNHHRGVSSSLGDRISAVHEVSAVVRPLVDAVAVAVLVAQTGFIGYSQSASPTAVISKPSVPPSQRSLSSSIGDARVRGRGRSGVTLTVPISAPCRRTPG